MTTEDPKAVVRRFLEAGVGRGDIAAFAELVSPDVTTHPDANVAINGTDELIATIFEFRRAFPDLTVVIEDQIAEGDRVATRFNVHGTHLGDFADIGATGSSVTTQVLQIARVAEGQIVEMWTEFDALEVLDQLDPL